MIRHGRNQPQVEAAVLRPKADRVSNAIARDLHAFSHCHFSLRDRYSAPCMHHESRLVRPRSLHRGVLRTSQKLNSP